MPEQATVDVLSQQGNSIKASGSTAMRLLQADMNVNALRTLDVLRKDEWIQYDQALIEVARQRLTGVDDLMSRGLSLSVANALGTTRVEWETLSDMDPAQVSMAAVTADERDRVDFVLQSVPLPVIHKGFQLNIRALEASRRTGETLDTTQARLATRLVTERIEDMLFNGVSLTAIGGTIEGYTTATNRNTGNLTGANGWITGTTGEDALSDILTMIGVLRADRMYGPYGLYVPDEWWTNLLEDFKANSDKSTITRVMEIPDLQFVKPTSNLTGTVAGTSGDEVILVQLTSDVVDMVDGMQPTMIQWDAMGGLVLNFKVMAIMVPRMKSTQTTQSGIAHYTVA